MENKRPIVRVTGSHQRSCVFGAVSIEGKKKKKQLFRQYNIFDGDTFLDYLKIIHAKFPKCYLFMDKASQSYKSKKVIRYFEENKDTLIPLYLPTASPEFMVMEEIWNIAKRDLLVLQYYSSFEDLKNKISEIFQNKKIQSEYVELFVTRGSLTYAEPSVMDNTTGDRYEFGNKKRKVVNT